MIAFYCDEDAMSRKLIQALRLRRVDVLSASEAGLIHRSDEIHLAYATQQNRVLYSFNVSHFCRIHNEWLTAGKSHSGILLGHQQRRYSVGTQLRGLLKLAAQFETADMRDRLEYLSKWIG